MLLPKEVEEDGDEGSAAADDSSADLEALAAVATHAGLAGKLENSAPPEDGFSAVARLAWGVLLANHAPANFRGEVQYFRVHNWVYYFIVNHYIIRYSTFR